MDSKEIGHFSPSFCLTHRCNLNCVYCYQKHDNATISFETAKKVLHKIFTSPLPQGCQDIHIGFIGGEPLVEFELMKKICEYAWETYTNIPYLFYATTNGTNITFEQKKWFIKNQHRFQLGLSLDGTPDTQNHNRSNSYSKIDIPFFQKYYKSQGVKMTLSEYSLNNLAENIIYLHNLGFDVYGSNLAEGNFKWDDEKYIPIVARELNKLVDFYIKHPKIKVCQFFDKKLAFCESKEVKKEKYCGTGNGANFYDIDGQEYPCPFITPMTFSVEILTEIAKTDFKCNENFIDEDCYNNCYVYSLCSTCAGNNYKQCGCFNKREKSKCKITKLQALFLAELMSQRIIKKQIQLKDDELYYTIEAIKKIKSFYYEEFYEYIK